VFGPYRQIVVIVEVFDFGGKEMPAMRSDCVAVAQYNVFLQIASQQVQLDMIVQGRDDGCQGDGIAISIDFGGQRHNGFEIVPHGSFDGVDGFHEFGRARREELAVHMYDLAH
jgi:hypothetical protein